MKHTPTQALPITAALPALATALEARDEVVLQAPPGAGKTTLVPLELLRAPWLKGRKILLLEPRRMAARTAAARMAELLGETLGETVGYRIRMESRVSPQTRIEVITEGVLTRRLQNDPGLEDVGVVVFDEFHERSLDTDLCLALCLQGRELFREGDPLKLLVMSATLDTAALVALMDNAPVVTSAGRQHPVETVFGRTLKLQQPLAPAVADTLVTAMAEHPGSALVFLPGQREIRAVARELERRCPWGADVDVAPLYGSLPLAQQQRAIAPVPGGQRKVVLATNVAETSLTIEGISIVVDSGLAREVDFDPVTGVSRLVTRRISLASAAQRQGRAGRLGPGWCYRLWSEEQQGRLVAHGCPEILQADLASLALQLLAWGVADPAELRWLDPPPAAAWQQALAVLRRCQALTDAPADNLRLTPHGERLAQLPLHPRLAHMLLLAWDLDAKDTGSLLAAVLSERGPGADVGADIQAQLALLAPNGRCPQRLKAWSQRVRQLARRYAEIAERVHAPGSTLGGTGAIDAADVGAALLACAYPDRVAQGRGEGRFLLANGRSAQLSRADVLASEEWLAVAELGGERGSSSDRIFTAIRLNPSLFSGGLAHLVETVDSVQWNQREARFSAQRRRMLGAIALSAEALATVCPQARSAALLGEVRRRGLAFLPWDDNTRQWRARVQLLRAHTPAPNPWPDVSDTALLASLETWLAPWLVSVSRLEDFARLDMAEILAALLPWPLPQELQRLAPTRITVPSGSAVKVDYTVSPPVLAVKLQEMFGCDSTPTVAAGEVALMVHLLSPAQRPLQVTQDLAGFWRGSYQQVKKEMKGRYPKHPWPDDPTTAPASRYTKRRSGN